MLSADHEACFAQMRSAGEEYTTACVRCVQLYICWASEITDLYVQVGTLTVVLVVLAVAASHIARVVQGYEQSGGLDRGRNATNVYNYDSFAVLCEHLDSKERFVRTVPVR